MQFAFFDVPLFNLIAGSVAYINSLEKLQPIWPISIYEQPLSNNQIKFFTYSIYPFLLESFFLPTQPPFNQSHLLLEK